MSWVFSPFDGMNRIKALGILGETEKTICGHSLVSNAAFLVQTSEQEANTERLQTPEHKDLSLKTFGRAKATQMMESVIYIYIKNLLLSNHIQNYKVQEG